MKNPLTRRIPRLLVSKPGSYLPIFLISLVAIFFLSSFFIAQNSIKPLYYQQLSQGKVEDGQIRMLAALTPEQISQVEDHGLKMYPNFYRELDFTRPDSEDNTADSGKKSPKTLRVFPNRTQVNLAIVNQGKLPQAPHEIAIDAPMSRVAHIRLGDKIKFGVKTLTVSGIVTTPDYSTVLRNSADMVMDNGHFGTAFMTKQGYANLANIPGAKENYLYSYRLQEKLPETKARDVYAEVLSTVSKSGIVMSAENFFDNRCIQYFMDDMDGDVPMMFIVMVLIFISLAFMTTIQTRGLIEEEAPVIGTLLASGYTRRNLMVHYSLIPTTLMLLAAGIGNILAYTFGFRIYADVYYDTYSLPTFVPIFSLRSFFITTLVPLLIVCGLNLVILRRYFRLPPLRFLRQDLKKRERRFHLSLQRLSFLKAFRIRVLWDNRINILALMFGIFIGNIMLMYGLSMEPMVRGYANQVKTEMKYNYITLVKQPVADYEQEQKGLLTSLEISVPGKTDPASPKEISVYGLDKNSRYHAATLDTLEKNQVIVSKGLADRYQLVSGDKIGLKRAGQKEYRKFSVAGIFKDISDNQAFMPLPHLDSFLEMPAGYYNAYLSDYALSVDQDNLITVIDRTKLGDYLENFISSFGGVFKSFLVISLAFYFALVSVVSKLVLDRSRLNITYLKVLGYRDREITRIYLTTICLAMMVFYVVTLPLLDCLLRFTFRLGLSKLDIYIGVNLPLVNYLYLFVAGLVIFLAVQLLQARKIRKLDMVTELKTISG